MEKKVIAHLNYIYKRIFVNFNGFMYFFFYIDLGLIVLGECICNPFFHILIENAQFVSYLNAKQVS